METYLNPLQRIAAPAGCALIASLFLISGINKITGYAATVGYMEWIGVPGALLPLVILLEVGGGLLLLIGYKTRLVALLLGGFTLITGVLFHLLPSYGLDGLEAQNQTIYFLKNLAVAGGLGVVFANGAGGLSIDNWQPARRSAWKSA